MTTQVKIPEMGESISSGILAHWHVKDGDYVEKDAALYELETDKITSEAPAEVSGQISIQVQAGEEVEIGQIIATIDESAGPPDVRPASATQAMSEAEDPSAKLSPAARKACTETGIDPKSLVGSGKDGRITKNDILEIAPTSSGPAKQAQPASNPTENRGIRETEKKMSPLRRKIAERLVAASQENAMLTTFNEVDMSAVMELRRKHQEDFVNTHGVKLGFMSFFTKAVTHALRTVPEVNARIEGDSIISQHFYDIGIAVGTDKGLMVPVLRDCDQKSFSEIETDILTYANAARDSKIQMKDLEGGVFTISNGGIYGSMLSTPIVNHPQPAILGLHTITKRPVVVDDAIVIRPMMYLALSYDHRLIDGKEAVTFLVKVKEAIEDPSRLLFNL